MLETLLELDKSLFHVLNFQWRFSFLDWFMPWITDFKRWVPVLLPCYLWLLLGAKGKHRLLAFALLFAVGASDVVSSRIIKKSVARKRPCCTEFESRKLIGCKSSPSFPSSHAANTAAVAAVVLTMRGLAIGLPITTIAFLVGYSRIYVGVHFPVDVFSGFFLGAMIGCIFGWIFRKREMAVGSKDQSEKSIGPEESPHSQDISSG